MEFSEKILKRIELLERLANPSSNGTLEERDNAKRRIIELKTKYPNLEKIKKKIIGIRISRGISGGIQVRKKNSNLGCTINFPVRYETALKFVQMSLRIKLNSYERELLEKKYKKYA